MIVKSLICTVENCNWAVLKLKRYGHTKSSIILILCGPILKFLLPTTWLSYPSNTFRGSKLILDNYFPRRGKCPKLHVFLQFNYTGFIKTAWGKLNMNIFLHKFFWLLFTSIKSFQGFWKKNEKPTQSNVYCLVYNPTSHLDHIWQSFVSGIV